MSPVLRNQEGEALRSVCWGYRDIFRKAIEALVQQGYIGGPGREEVTSRFFDFINCSDRSLFDHVVKELLEAVGPATAWILDVPSLFEDILALAARFSEQKLYYGIHYFRILGEGGFGESPREVRNLLAHLSPLADTDYELAFAFLRGYGSLRTRLNESEITLYVDEGLRFAGRSKDAGIRFLEATGKASDTVILSLTHEARLSDLQPELERLARALAGREIEIRSLSELDADEIIERGSRLVGLYRWMYVPERIRFFAGSEKNRDWYLLQIIAASAAVSLGGFAAVHGHREFPSLETLVGNSPSLLNVVVIVEYCRIVSTALRSWPGAKRYFRLGVEAEQARRSHGGPEQAALAVLQHVLEISGLDSAVVPVHLPRLSALASRSESVFDTAHLVDEGVIEEVRAAYPDFDSYTIRALAFLPDPLFPVSESAGPPDRVVADLKQSSEQRREDSQDGDADQRASTSDESVASDQADDEVAPEGQVKAVYLYDEWNQKESEYLPNFCMVRESTVKSAESLSLPPELLAQQQRVRRVFEMLKPVTTRKEKYLADGTEIDSDTLVDFLVSRTRFPSPKVRFYQRPRVQRRDLAVVVLLDVSGSTGEENEGTKIITLEQHAAIVLGYGLNALDDQFSVSGFSGTGPEDCRYFIYKEFSSSWDDDARGSIMGAYPVSSTRIGPALRHSGHRLRALEAKQKLIILITDGRPMDQGYDPQSQYAQYDVRMACEENSRQSIHTFCISTTENSRSDMEIMFPHRRFVVLEDISQLPAVLPRLYVRLTV